MTADPLKGFTYKTIGFLPSEKVAGFNWSGAGDIFNVFELESNKLSVTFYMISSEQTTTTTENQSKQA